jgi:hypothetical protein
MGKYAVYHSARFDWELEKFDNDFKEWLDKMEDQLVDNPYSGDPLNVKWFREKKYKKYRVYFLVYDDLSAVYMVGISSKKDQQKVINTIRLLLEFFREEMENLGKK